MIQSKCCKAPVKNISCEDGTGFMLCSKCASACDMENEDKTTAVKVLSEITGIPEYRISNPDLGEYITKTGALLAMEEYSNQQSADLIKQIEEKDIFIERLKWELYDEEHKTKNQLEELKEENKRLNKVMPMSVYDECVKQNEFLQVEVNTAESQIESLSQVIDSQKQTMDSVLTKYMALSELMGNIENELLLHQELVTWIDENIERDKEGNLVTSHDFYELLLSRNDKLK